MENIIEIIDSDEEGTRESEKQLSIPKHEAGTTPNTSRKTKASTEVPSISSIATVSNPTKVAPTMKSARPKNRRKSMHQPLRASPNMHFETITLDDDDSNITAQRRGTTSTTAHKIIKPQARLATKLTEDKAPPPAHIDIKNAKQDMHNLIREVAEERVRINHLLFLYGIPKMDFDLYIEASGMKAEFDDRFKQRKAQIMAAEN